MSAFISLIILSSSRFSFAFNNLKYSVQQNKFLPTPREQDFSISRIFFFFTMQSTRFVLQFLKQSISSWLKRRTVDAQVLITRILSTVYPILICAISTDFLFGYTAFFPFSFSSPKSPIFVQKCSFY